MRAAAGQTLLSPLAQSSTQRIELGPTDAVDSVTPPGQSELESNPHALDQAALWMGETFKASPIGLPGVKAMGATTPGLIALLSKGHIRLVLIGFLIAAPLAYITMNWWLSDFAYRIGINVGLFALAGVATVLIAFLTVGRQALKAVSANPVESLRYE